MKAYALHICVRNSGFNDGHNSNVAGNRALLPALQHTTSICVQQRDLLQACTGRKQIHQTCEWDTCLWPKVRDKSTASTGMQIYVLEFTLYTRKCSSCHVFWRYSQDPEFWIASPKLVFWRWSELTYRIEHICRLCLLQLRVQWHWALKILESITMGSAIRTVHPAVGHF